MSLIPGGPRIALRCNRRVSPHVCRSRNPLPKPTEADGEKPCAPSEERFKDERAREKDVLTLTSIVTGTRPALHVYFICWKKRETLCWRSRQASARFRTLRLYFFRCGKTGYTNDGYQALCFGANVSLLVPCDRTSKFGNPRSRSYHLRHSLFDSRRQN